MFKVVATLFLLVISTAAFAQSSERFRVVHLAVDAFPAGGEGVVRAQVSPEYAWKAGIGRVKLSGFGFYEMRSQGDDFTNHSVAAQWGTIPVVLVSEQGGSASGFFHQAGVRLIVSQTPVVGKYAGKVFNGLSVAYLAKTTGAHPPNEILLGWETKRVHIGGAAVHSEGFMRFRGGNRADYGQPQIWLTPSRHPRISVGVELEVVGGQLGWQMGTRICLVQ